jgi:WD40 repeat protein
MWDVEGVDDVLVLADSRLLFWSSYSSIDTSMRLWDGRSGNRLLVLQGHNKTVLGAMELTDGRLLSWSMDNTFRTWDLQNGKCLEIVAEDHVAKRNPEWVTGRRWIFTSA